MSNAKEQKISIIEAALSPGQRPISAFPEVDVSEKHKSSLKKKFECICEGFAKQENHMALNEIYTELYIILSGTEKVIKEHEFIQYETASWRAATEDTPIKCNDIFKPLPGQDKPIRAVLTTGVAGIGKTVSVQKFILDWTEGKANQDIHFIFPLPFRELNLMSDQEQSLMDLLSGLFMETKNFDFFSNEQKVLFIFDGLDECRLPLNFRSEESLRDVTESTSVDVLLINLIKGNVLPSALIWITSRPAAASQIPSKYVDQITEIRGFNDSQKEEYFRKRISDQNLANRITLHAKSSKTLNIMCHIPLFCWMLTTVLERIFKGTDIVEIPKTLTQLYTHFLIIHITIIKEKYAKQVERELIFKLGRLAFQQLLKGNVIFYEEDLRECGLDVREASVYAGMFTQIFKEVSGKVYCFVHLSIQEHLAALYVYLSFMIKNENVLTQSRFSKLVAKVKVNTIFDLHKSAVDQALQSKNGHLDLFLCFFLGLSTRSSQTPLQGLLTKTSRRSQRNSKTIQYIKKKIRENSCPEKSISLIHCLNEMNDHSLLEDIHRHLSSLNLCESDLSSSQWSALFHMLPTAKEKLEMFDLQKYSEELQMIPEKIILRLLPVVRASRSADLRNCNLTSESYSIPASALSSNFSCLRELDLSHNNLYDSRLELLSDGLENPHCKLEVLRLRSCNLTEKSCVALVSALTLRSASLKELDISNNYLQDSGVKVFSSGLEDSYFDIEILNLNNCHLTKNSCAALALVLNSKFSGLRELNMGKNKLQDSGVKLLSAGLENPHCTLEILGLSDCDLTENSCEALASALSSNSSCLRKLDLSKNNLQNSGMNLLSIGLKNSLCKLETLSLSDCKLTEDSCEVLASALCQNSYLRDLDLSKNRLYDSGIELLSAELGKPHSKLETLRLSDCNLTEKSCAALASVLKTQRSNSTSLKLLDLSCNKVQDSGVKQLCAGLENSYCQLEILSLKSCHITTKGCDYLASALKSNPLHLRELDLSLSSPGGSEKNHLCSLTQDPLFKLEKVM
ncbi:NACHT, LRR and PYD domains-containing protein 3-like [Chanos chanos]|uniref:NACHT, LRR and PYD domains-containing protein 3-like n=1 Tax=Chanos chanos TaxID=29144 RepID=A0A6J2VLE8_CHACN|nr:NACHT, LRR and PYD domains-containing protein 3-like [Chanos chanos]